MLMRSPLTRDRRSAPGFILPCQPTLSDRIPTGPEWLHEIKHDGDRTPARKDGGTVRLWSRNSRDWWSRAFLSVIAALQALPPAQIVLDGEAMAHCDEGLPDFHGLRSREQAHCAELPALAAWTGPFMRTPIRARRFCAAGRRLAWRERLVLFATVAPPHCLRSGAPRGQLRRRRVECRKSPVAGRALVLAGSWAESRACDRMAGECWRTGPPESSK
jgi:hypothetical protein